MELKSIVERIPIFKGFSPDQIEKMMSVSEERTVQEGEYLFNEGDPSTCMYILLSGGLQVLSISDTEIAVITQMGVVGEMGVLTDQPRSAGVMANSNSRILCISRDALFSLIQEDGSMGFKVYQNVTHILCDRLRENNILIEQQYLFLEDLTGEA